MPALIDTHCHIHDSDYDFLIDDVLAQAQASQIVAMICVGTDLRSSRQAATFSAQQPTCYASLGLHPHLATQPLARLEQEFAQLATLAEQLATADHVVAIGECGLDYFYHQDATIRQQQQTIFKWHLDLARKLHLPLIFHIRNAFADFWQLYDQYQLPGVVHSFSDQVAAVSRGEQYRQLYFGLNGIMTFTKEAQQLQAAQLIPANRLLLETDAPYLTPQPHRGRVNQPAYLPLIADFLANLRQTDVANLAQQTTQNAIDLFNFQHLRTTTSH